MKFAISVDLSSMNNRLSKKCRFWRGVLLAFLVAVLTAVSASAATIYRGFRAREVGAGFGAGTAGVAYPVDAKIDKAIDEARQKEAAKAKVIVEANDRRKNKRKM